MDANQELERRRAGAGGRIPRRDAMGRAACGLGWFAIAEMLHAEAARGLAAEGAGHGAPAASRVSPRARRVVLLFQHGGPSHIDLFDPKPALARYAGEPVPGGVEAFFDKKSSGKCLPSPFAFARHGACGMEFSELLPHLEVRRRRKQKPSRQGGARQQPT